MLNLFYIFLLTLIVENAECLQWCNVTEDDITSKHELGVNTTYSNENLVIDAIITNYGCGEQQSHIFVFINDFLANKWIKIRYKIEFWGSSICWSILGNTYYGDFENNFNTGLYSFDVTKGDSIISNQLLYGSWNGSNQTCNNDTSNFWQFTVSGEYKGSIIVEQRRNINAFRAGIGSGHSCSNIDVSKVRFSDIKVAYKNSDNVQCVKQNNSSSDVNNSIVWSIMVGICVFCMLVICAWIRKYKQRINETVASKTDVPTDTSRN
eukprot:192563_1